MRLGYILPTRFLGCLSLDIATELIIINGILNHFSGIYGLASLVTGHSTGFVQLSSNILLVISIPIYILTLKNINKVNPYVMSLFTHFYFIETLLTIAITTYFSLLWFKFDNQKVEPIQDILEPSAPDNTDQEKILTIFTTIFYILFRLYSTLIVAAFTKRTIYLEERQRQYSNIFSEIFSESSDSSEINYKDNSLNPRISKWELIHSAVLYSAVYVYKKIWNEKPNEDSKLVRKDQTARHIQILKWQLEQLNSFQQRKKKLE